MTATAYASVAQCLERTRSVSSSGRAKRFFLLEVFPLHSDLLVRRWHTYTKDNSANIHICALDIVRGWRQKYSSHVIYVNANAFVWALHRTPMVFRRKKNAHENGSNSPSVSITDECKKEKESRWEWANVDIICSYTQGVKDAVTSSFSNERVHTHSTIDHHLTPLVVKWKLKYYMLVCLTKIWSNMDTVH